MSRLQFSCNKKTIQRGLLFFTFGFVIYFVYLLYFIYPPGFEQKNFPLHDRKNLNYVSTCNGKSDKRGPNQKIIAYSIYGSLSTPELAQRYLKCFKETLAKVLESFPGWVVRIYYDVDSSDEIGWKNLQDSLPTDRSSIDLCNATKVIQERKLGRLFPMTWRFLPILDDLVDIFLSRDMDSPLLFRELAAVNEWLESNRTFHTMRDHPYHCTPMLGGLWGAKLNQNRRKITSAFKTIMAMNHYQFKGYDENLLRKYIWPFAKLDMMSHDSYCCHKFTSKPFPTPREGKKFVGMISLNGCQSNITIDGISEECPESCRPKNTLFDWRYC